MGAILWAVWRRKRLCASAFLCVPAIIPAGAGAGLTGAKVPDALGSDLYPVFVPHQADYHAVTPAMLNADADLQDNIIAHDTGSLFRKIFFQP